MFFNILTLNNKCFLLKRDNLRQPIQMQLSEKQKTFPQFFSPISKSKLNFDYFQKEDDPHNFMYFPNYGLQKTWLNKCLKSPVSEYLWTSNMVRRAKQS